PVGVADDDGPGVGQQVGPAAGDDLGADAGDVAEGNQEGWRGSHGRGSPGRTDHNRRNIRNGAGGTRRKSSDGTRSCTTRPAGADQRGSDRTEIDKTGIQSIRSLTLSFSDPR